MSKDSRPSATAGIEADALDRVHPDPIRPDADRTPNPPLDPRAGAVAAHDAGAAVVGNGEKPNEPTSTTQSSWLGEAVIDSLVHCACSHQSVHPDLLPLETGESSAMAVPRPAEVDDDAG